MRGADLDWANQVGFDDHVGFGIARPTCPPVSRRFFRVFVGRFAVSAMVMRYESI